MFTEHNLIRGTSVTISSTLEHKHLKREDNSIVGLTIEKYKKRWGKSGFQEVWRLAFVKTKDWKTLKILNDKTKRLQNCLDLKTEDLATKPEDRRFEFLTVKIWLLPYRMKIYTEFNSSTWLRLAIFAELTNSVFWLLNFNYTLYHWVISQKYNNRRDLNLANLPLAK